AIGGLHQLLHLSAHEFHVGWHRRQKFDKRMVKKRYAAFQTVRHAHAVFHMQQRGQQALEIEVRHLVEIGFFPDIVLVVEDRPKGFENPRLVQRAPIDFADHVGRTVDQPEIALIEVLEQALAPELLDHGLVFAEQAKIRHDRFDRDHVIAAAVIAVDGRLDALLEIGDQIASIAAQKFVASLAAEHHLEIFRSQRRHHILRERSGPGDRKIQVIDHVADMLAEILGRDVHHVKGHVRKLGDLARKVALVIAGKFEKAAVKRVPATMVQLGSQERNQAGVEPPRYIAADRHVRSHVYEHRVGQQLDKTPLEIAGAVIEVDVVLDVPIEPGGDRTVFDAKHVARKECRYALEER